VITIGAFALLAGAGALARAAAGRRLNVPGGWPWGTLVVNVTGSLALGLLHGTGAPAATVLGTGLVGAYTTFSTFARDAVALAERGQSRRVAAYVIVSVGGGVVAAAAGMALAG
jgi:CrcB protein